MMVALHHIRPAVLRGLALVLGVSFAVLAVCIRVLHDWQPGESALVLLIPFGIGAYLLLSALILQTDALRRAIVLLFVIIGPGLALATWAGCELQIFSSSFCGVKQ
jgi:hypothetical protein